MLTRLEVNGFKNLVNFSVDFGPFTCITGPGGVGKSNLIDAIRFLSLLTEHTINDAASRVRLTAGEAGDLTDLFFFSGGKRAERFEIAAEMVVRGNVRDDFGREAEPSSSFLRYELSFHYLAPSPAGGLLGGLILEREELRPITEARAGRHLKFPHSKVRFRDSAVHNGRHARSGFISTRIDPETGHPAVMVHQDGGYSGRGLPSPAHAAQRTVVGTENTAATPTILSAKQEMRGWQLLDLDPVAMRRPDQYQQRPGIAINGAHIPATLQHRVEEAEKQGLDPESVLDSLTVVLSNVAPINKLTVAQDDALELLSLVWQEPSGLTVSGAAMSTSALRFLAFTALAQSPEPPPLLCIECPEIGLEPRSLETLNSILHDMAVNPNEEIGPDNPLRQAIVVTQSPYLWQLQEMRDLLLAQPERTTPGEGSINRHVLRCYPHTGSWRCVGPDDGIDLSSVRSYPEPPQKLQIGFPAQFWNEA